MYRNIPLQPAPDCPIVQYASGRTQAKRGSETRYQNLVGFHSECGKDLDFDALCEAAHLPQITIRHMSGEITTHWSFGSQVRIHVLTAGPPATTISACLSPRFRAATGESGIGLSWKPGEKSRMAVRGYLAIGVQHAMVQLSVTSTMTGYLLAALLDHIRVCQLADAIIQQKGKRTELVYPVEVALPLGVGPEVAAGSTETTQISPLVSLHTAVLTAESLRALWASNQLCEIAWSDWAAVQAWAMGYGVDTNGDSTTTLEETPAAAAELFPREAVSGAAAGVAGPSGRKGRH